MGRARGDKQYLGLVKGLVTEANPLAFPEGATQDEQNFLLDLDGVIRKRRKGLANANADFNVSHTPVPALIKLLQLDGVYYWQAPDVILVVYRRDADDGMTDDSKTVVYFHRNNSTFDVIDSYELHSDNVPVQIAENTNTLAISLGSSRLQTKPYLFEYEEDTNEIKLYEIDLFIRDFELVPDSLEISERPAVLSDEHRYNLLNAGWYSQRKLKSSGSLGDPIADFFTDTTTYPSNADIAAIGVKADASGNELFSADTITEVILGNSEAPRGHYVYNVNSFDRNTRLADPSEDGTVDNTIGTPVKTVTL